jgi:hypothetical protein
MLARIGDVVNAVLRRTRSAQSGLIVACRSRIRFARVQARQ